MLDKYTITSTIGYIDMFPKASRIELNSEVIREICVELLSLRDKLEKIDGLAKIWGMANPTYDPINGAFKVCSHELQKVLNA